jgi:hypothetical protein
LARRFNSSARKRIGASSSRNGERIKTVPFHIRSFYSAQKEKKQSQYHSRVRDRDGRRLCNNLNGTKSLHCLPPVYIRCRTVVPDPGAADIFKIGINHLRLKKKRSGTAPGHIQIQPPDAHTAAFCE